VKCLQENILGRIPKLQRVSGGGGVYPSYPYPSTGKISCPEGCGEVRYRGVDTDRGIPGLRV